MSFKKVRDAHKTENTEDYCEIIGDLLNSKGEARIVDIANKLGIAQATANKTVKRLQTQGYLKKEPYRSIFLTLKGQELASASKKRHITVVTFLKNLGLKPYFSVNVFVPLFNLILRFLVVTELK